MREELEQIKGELNKNYRLGLEIKGDKLVTEKFNGYINSDDTYLEIERKAIMVCDYITENYDYFSDYSILSGYELVIEVF
jgi:hypothetical protein